MSGFLFQLLHVMRLIYSFTAEILISYLVLIPTVLIIDKLNLRGQLKLESLVRKKSEIWNFDGMQTCALLNALNK